MIRRASPRDIANVAEIHRREISEGFLSSLGEKFLQMVYHWLISSGDSLLLVSEDNGIINGFVSGTTDTEKMYAGFVRSNLLPLLPLALRNARKPSFIGRVLSIRRHMKAATLPKAELLSIAVLKEHQGRGIASKMLRLFIKEMKMRDVSEFKVLVGESLKPAIGFYEAFGFRLHSGASLHGQSSRIYLYKLK